ncbi:ATP-binding cassette long-chain fatty acid transporter pxa1 [Lecanora helva]
MAAQSTLRHSGNPLVKFFDLYARYIPSSIKKPSKATRLVATLALLFSIISGAYGGRKWLKRRSRKIAQNQRLLRRNSGLRGKDGSRTIVVPYRSSTAEVKIHPTKPTTFDAHRRLFLNPPRAARLGDGPVTSQVPPPNVKPGLNIAFIHQFLSLLSIMIPHWNSKESGLLFSQGLFLLLRTYLSLVVTRLDGEIVRDLVAGNGRSFLWGIVKWCGVGGFASYTNAAIKFLQSKVAIAFRTRLTRYIHDLYLNDNLSYYKLLNLDGGIGQGADQFITNDLTLFTASAASLYSSIGKPLVDFFVFNFQLYQSLGPLALTGLLANYILTATALRRLSPPFGKLKAVEGRKEGDFRGLHARLIANAEEVAFYGGADMEKVFLDKSYRDLKTWMEGIYRLKIRYNMLEDFVLKYSWSAFGYLITSLPIFLPEWGGLDGQPSDSTLATTSSPTTSRSHARMQQFITNKRLMLSLADAGGRMMYSIKDLSELAGYASRVYMLISTLHRVHASAYYPPRGTTPEPYSLSDILGTLHRGYDGVRLENVPLVAPAIYPLPGDPIIPSLSFTITSSAHVLISGPNGAGKSSIARVLAGLWPVYRGLVSRPRNAGTDGIMFLPQRPYLAAGTLRDQVIYPHSEMDMRDAGRRDAELQQVLTDVRLGYLPEREGGWDVRKEWKDVLSGGEKQRMAFARLLYHEPRYAVIDEGTSAVSSDVEGLLYDRCKERGITLLTISTRVSLKRYHQWNLDLGTVVGEDEDGGDGREEEWVFERVGSREETEGVEREVRTLRERLGMVEGWKERLAEVERELGMVWEKGEDEGGSGSEVVEEPEYLEKVHGGEERDKSGLAQKESL